MLVARRDPPFEAGPHDDSRLAGAHPVHAPHHSRFMTALQVVATLVGIPVGLASAYSIYHANFTDEARCETLRGNIVSMLDKSADASTLRMLVRRDVVSFEQKCGAVDPDAVKAFKMLLARKPPETPQAAREPVRETKRTEPAKAEPAKAAAAPVPQAKPAEAKTVEPKPVEAKRAEPKSTEPADAARATEVDDAKWIASVRDALIRTPGAERTVPAAPAKVPAAPERPLGQLRAVPDAANAPAAAAAPAAVSVAPQLPAPVAVTATPAPADPADHPVPPGAIPDPQPSVQAPQSASGKSGHSWMANIPVLSRFVTK